MAQGEVFMWPSTSERKLFIPHQHIKPVQIDQTDTSLQAVVQARGQYFLLCLLFIVFLEFKMSSSGLASDVNAALT